jgi:hypothetical protein
MTFRRAESGPFWDRVGRVKPHWLDRFWRAKGDPTRDWTPGSRELEVTLERHALCGVSLYEDSSPLRGLGPADNSRLAARGGLDYGALGLHVGVDPQTRRVEDFGVAFQHDPDSMARYEGVLLYQGQRLRWSAATREEERIPNPHRRRRSAHRDGARPGSC